VRSKKVTH